MNGQWTPGDAFPVPEMSGETYYKVTGPDGEAIHGGIGRWTPGRWRSVHGGLVPCRRGLHLCRADQLVYWLGPVIWEAEVQGEVIDAADKMVARRARVVRRVEAWDERTARLFAADCAEHVLHLVPEPYRATCAATIATARRYADGQATLEELAAAYAAAYAAAWAAEAAAEAAAWAAARAVVGAAAAAARAAYAAAWAAEAAARAAEAAAAAVAEREWQTARLCELLGIER